MSDERQTNISKYMCKKSNDIICDLLFYFVLAVILGLLTILLAFLGSFITNILVVLLHIIIQKKMCPKSIFYSRLHTPLWARYRRLFSASFYLAFSSLEWTVESEHNFIVDLWMIFFIFRVLWLHFLLVLCFNYGLLSELV